MRSRHDPVLCFVPPHVLEHLARSADPSARRLAMDTATLAAAARTYRATLATMPSPFGPPALAPGKRRFVHDMRQARFDLPGALVRSEGEPSLGDAAVDEAYENSGAAHDFYHELFGRDSVDGHGLPLVSSVHFGRDFTNAFWNGEQLFYGDGEGAIFVRFTRALDVVGHELTHGVILHECNLEYRDEPGALNEHFADAFGAMLKQWHKKQSVFEADWLVGDEIMGPGVQARAIRTFKAEKAYADDPILGTDPQPKHARDKYHGSDDNGGVHLNSGIPNHAFYRAATGLGGRSWEKVGWIWYETLKRLTPTSRFRDAARVSVQVAGEQPRGGASERSIVRQAWAAVGIAG